jgi:hypothetical protein
MTLTIALLVTYLIFCALVGLCGIHRRMGFTGTFILSIFVTPVVALVVLLITAPSRRIESERQSRNDRGA